MKTNAAVRILFLVVLVILLATFIMTVVARVGQDEAKAPLPVAASPIDGDTAAYMQIQHYIDEGNYLGIAEMLLNGEVSETLYATLVKEDIDIMEAVIVDAMLLYAEQGYLEKIVSLRINGYVSDQCFLNYWERMGCEKPEDTETLADVDSYLTYEMYLAYLRDENIIANLRELKADGVLSEELHVSLVNALGFDYTADLNPGENGMIPLVVLTDEEQQTYETVMELIDQGEGQQVFQMCRYGEVNQVVFHELEADDSEIIDYIIADGLAGLAVEGEMKDLVSLRVNGYVSDACFEYYWELTGSYVDPDRDEEDLPGVDMYLLYELEQIYEREEDGKDVLSEIWYSGLISDETHEELMNRLGFDYTQEQ